MEHPEHLATFLLVKIEQDVLADDQAEVVPRRREQKQIVPRERHLVADVVRPLARSPALGRLEIAIPNGIRNPLDFISA